MKNTAHMGYEVVCPDGIVRHYPHHNEGDAESMAREASKPLPRQRVSGCCVSPAECSCAPGAAGKIRDTVLRRPGCSPWPAPSDLELKHPACAGGVHVVRPMVLQCRSEERGQA